jgi:hypothetical protein
VRTWAREHGLLLANLAAFVGFLIAMALTGWSATNEELSEHEQPPESLGAFLASGDFYEALFENWESEFLQMGAYVVLTVFLFQKGSAESKPLDEPAPQDEDPRTHGNDPNAPWPVRQGGLVLKVYENSLFLLFGVLFIGAFIGHAAGGAAAYNEQLALHGGEEVSVIEYMGTSQFWFESLQNWQSEFMVVALLIGAGIYLRQRGSNESKPVHAPHADTGG